MIGGLGVLAARGWTIARDLAGAFLKSRAGRLAALALLVAFVGWLACRHAYGVGVSDERAARAARDAKAAKVIAHVATAGKAITAEVSHDLEARRVEIRTVTKTLTKEVPVYVTVQSDRACIVPDGFVRLHDAAADGAALPGSASGSVEAPSGIPLSVVGETVVVNYGVAHEWLAEVIAWRAWYVRHADLWKQNIRPPDPASDRSPAG
ncbi:hypothetical protein [Caulobacter sp. RL271]|uniref:Uncharacterized protein n=1 Tax=Caulobacter segnis TaxID=88688 RepID=A0ABY4ZY02_9CAUL|nr:hypothetical protein [Caulobacter segnis]USQ97224.1 hypothetical protein MZV50_06695 [Caulobacter segnis]